MAKIKHNILIRNLDHETYIILWNMRRRYKARSWADLLKKIAKEWAEEIEELEWI